MAEERRRTRRGAEEAEASSQGANFPKTHYLQMKDKEIAILRFLTEPDEWVDADTHAMVPTKGKPADAAAEQKWPAVMGAVCRKTKMGDGKPLYNDCYICDNMRDQKGNAYKRQGRTWALAVLREQVIGDGTPDLGGAALRGKRVGFRNVMREQAILDEKGKPTGSIETVPALVVVNQAWKNFFSTLAGAAKVHGTLLDRDYWIVRSGDSTDTTYQITPLDPVPGFDVRDPEVAAQFGLVIDPSIPSDGEFDPKTGEWLDRIQTWPAMYNLDDVVFGQSSDEFYGRFFDPTKTTSAKTNTQPSKPNTEATPERLSALADRVRSYSPTDVGESAPQPLVNFN